MMYSNIGLSFRETLPLTLGTEKHEEHRNPDSKLLNHILLSYLTPPRLTTLLHTYLP